jgi:hypothetical protein
MENRVIETTYFAQKGKQNTSQTLEIAERYAEQMGIHRLVVATTHGATGRAAAEMLQNYEVIVVTHSTGFSEPNTQSLTEENRQAIEAAGARLLTCQHAFGGVGRAVRINLSGHQVDEIIAHTLRTMGQGVKVACEISLMAADAGLVRTDEDVIAIGGSGHGADTAVVLQPANAMRFFELRLRGILCKPWDF